ncbi:MAG: AmmeMemoRadiSam system protein B [Acidipila sp.]|nr:AmmeMemoRadiSam system protein B [Acidipila sp.]
MIRQPAVAGRFYPAQPQQLLEQLETFIEVSPAVDRVRARGCLVPHAGYKYSGAVAGAVFARIALPAKFILLCPQHYRVGEPLAIVSEGAWRTPLGDVQIDSQLAVALKGACPELREDSTEHRVEHALEVQLPFLQRLAGNFTFVPIALGTDRLAQFETLGEGIAEAVAAQPDPVLIVASSDMNHYEADDVTRKKDQRAIDKILALDAVGLYEVVRREGITMCGYGPAVTMLTAAKRLGATKAEVVRYATSGDVSGDKSEVVGYSGIIVA